MKLTYEEYLTRYPNAYSGFIQNMNRTENLFQHMRELNVFDHVTSFISIGSGYGDLEIKIAQVYNIPFSIVEPTKLFFNSFIEKVNHAQLKISLIEDVNQSFDHFETKREYDLALSIHSWYAFGTQKSYFDKFKKLIHSRGKLFINLMSEKSIVSRLSALSSAGGISLTSEVVSQWLTSEGVKHQYVMEHNHRPFDLYVEQDQLTQAGRDFVAFLLASPWESIPMNLRNEAVALFNVYRQGDIVDVCSGSILISPLY